MYKKGSKGWFKHYDFILLDLICLQIAFCLAFVIRHGISNPYLISLYRNIAIFIEFTDIAVIFFFETLKNVIKRGYHQEFIITVQHASIVELVSVFYLFSLQEGQNYSRIVLYLMGVFYVFITYVTRIIWKKILKKKMLDGGNRSLLIVTEEAAAPLIIENIKKHNYEMYTIAGLVVLDYDRIGSKIAGIPVVANMESAVGYVCREWVDEVFIVSYSGLSNFQKMIDGFIEMGVTVHFNLSGVFEAHGKKRLVEKIGSYTVLTTSINYATAKQIFMKRALDIFGGLVGCILTGILFVFVAPAIYINSPGSIFFSQMRVGKNGKKFKMYKFRSMYMDAEERKKDLVKDNRIDNGMMFKLDFDPRVIGNKILPDGRKKTGIGNFLRVTSLDEFPQFFNVLKGEMSIVGTRPPTLDEWELYELRHRARLTIKPGITGMWQISGRSEITDFEEIVRLDTEYISEWSIGLDFRIIFKTCMEVLKRKGAL